MIDPNSAKQAARRLFKKFNYQDGPMGSYQLSALLGETYNILKIPFKPTQNDIKSYQQVLDADRDGKVTLRDLEARAVEYLCSNSILQGASTGSSSGSYKQFDSPPLPQQNVNYQASSSFNYSQSSSYQTESYNKFSQPVPANVESDGAYYSYNMKSSVPSSEETISRSTFAQNQQAASLYGANPASEPDRYLGQSEPQNYINNSYAPNQPQGYGYEQEAQEQQYAQYEDRQYSEEVRQYLDVINRVYLRYANPVDYTVVEGDVADLLRDTYEVLGREGYVPSADDVRTWMKLCDVNEDGKVEFQDFEHFVINSLERSGLNVYD